MIKDVKQNVCSNRGRAQSMKCFCANVRTWIQIPALTFQKQSFVPVSQIVVVMGGKRQEALCLASLVYLKRQILGLSGTSVSKEKKKERRKKRWREEGRKEGQRRNWVRRQSNIISGLYIHSYREVNVHTCIQHT